MALLARFVGILFSLTSTQAYVGPEFTGCSPRVWPKNSKLPQELFITSPDHSIESDDNPIRKAQNQLKTQFLGQHHAIPMEALMRAPMHPFPLQPPPFGHHHPPPQLGHLHQSPYPSPPSHYLHGHPPPPPHNPFSGFPYFDVSYKPPHILPSSVEHICAHGLRHDSSCSRLDTCYADCNKTKEQCDEQFLASMTNQCQQSDLSDVCSYYCDVITQANYGFAKRFVQLHFDVMQVYGGCKSYEMAHYPQPNRIDHADPAANHEHDANNGGIFFANHPQPHPQPHPNPNHPTNAAPGGGGWHFWRNKHE